MKNENVRKVTTTTRKTTIALTIRWIQFSRQSLIAEPFHNFPTFSLKEFSQLFASFTVYVLAMFSDYNNSQFLIPDQPDHYLKYIIYNIL